MESVISIRGLSKTYRSGLSALSDIDLDIRRGEIFALLGPNGAGKTTLISTICGILTKSAGTISVGGHDTTDEFRAARRLIGLVPQELNLSIFESVWDTVTFSRSLYGKPRDPALIERLIRQLSLWDKRRDKIVTLSGGMKRRVLIAKALSHEPSILFLDEPTAGVDVELRMAMWQLVRDLRDTGVTIILTTHYIEEAEELADRVGVINRGRLVVVDEKAALLHRLGRKLMTFRLAKPMRSMPKVLAGFALELSDDGSRLVYRYDSHGPRDAIAKLIAALASAKIGYSDIETEESSLEDIFIDLVKQ